MLCTTAEDKSEIKALQNRLKPASYFKQLIVPRRYLCCVSIRLRFWCHIFELYEPDVRFHRSSQVRVTEMPPTGKKLITRLTIWFLIISTELLIQ